MFFKNHQSFLKDILFYTLSAFGGPQGHLGMIYKKFVQEKKYLSEEELIDLNTFCQLLPGPSSTQLLTLIAYKRGGILLSIISLLIWIIPASFLMGAFSFLIMTADYGTYFLHLFRFIQPMAIGFLLFAVFRTYQFAVTNTITKVIMFSSTLITFLLFKLPWIFPILLIIGGIITNFSDKRIKIIKRSEKKFTPKWILIFIFFSTFLSLGILSETARKQNWENRKLYNLSENFFRFGTIVFGGGDVLLPLMLDQYVARPTNKNLQIRNPNIIKIPQDKLLTGFGIVRILPGPVFSISTYVGGLAVNDSGNKIHISGMFLCTLFIFLPGLLLVFFFFPVWEYLKNYVFFLRAMEGIQAVSTGLMAAGLFYILRNYFSVERNDFDFLITIMIIPLTFLLMSKTKTPAPIIVLLMLLLGFLF